MSVPYWPGSPQIFQQLAIDGENLSIVPGGNTVTLPTTYSTFTTSNLTASTIFTNELVLDSQTLNATPSSLLLNGVPIVTTSNLSSIADWSFEPALTNVYMDNFSLISTGTVDANTISSQQGYFSSLSAKFITCETLTAISTIQSFNYVSSHSVITDTVVAGDVSTNVLTVSSINGYTVGDFLSTSAVNPTPSFSTLTVADYGLVGNFLSTPSLFCSSINGAEFTGANGGGIVISTLVTNSISSIVGDVQFQLVSTLGFSLGSNSFSLGGVNLGLGNILGQLTGGALGIVGAATGIAGLATGTAALFQTRGTNNINTANYEMINGTTQLQVSTIGDYVSSVYRFSSGVPADQQIGEEVFVSTIFSPGLTLLRSMGDPVNTASTPFSTIQAFGQWVALPQAPAVSTVSTFFELNVLTNTSTQTLNVDFINGYSGTGNLIFIGDPISGANMYFDTTASAGGLQLDSVPSGNSFMNADKIAIDFLECKAASDITVNANVQRLVASNTNFLVSTVQIGPSTILTAENDVPGLTIRQSNDFSVAQLNCSAVAIGDINSTFQGAYSYAPSFDRATVVNSSIQTKFVAYLDDLQNIQNNSVSTITLNAGTAKTTALTVSSINNTAYNPFTGTVSTFNTLSTNTLNAGTATTTALTISSINNTVYQAFAGGQYYRTTNQNLPTGNNFLLFDASKPWNSTDFIQTDPSTFLCSTTGTYQIGLNTTILAATGTWTALLKSLIIQQDRGGAQSVVINSMSIPSPQNYGQSASAVLDINQGDSLRFITGQTLATGSTISLGLANVFDYNTFWDYQLLRKN